jgi:hypothetical protein
VLVLVDRTTTLHCMGLHPQINLGMDLQCWGLMGQAGCLPALDPVPMDPMYHMHGGAVHAWLKLAACCEQAFLSAMNTWPGLGLARAHGISSGPDGVWDFGTGWRARF